MKVAQEIDVDNVTIIINPQNKLEAKIPTSTPSEVVIEEINANLRFTFDQGIVVHKNDTNTNHPLTKLGRIKGTDWLVIRAKGVFGDVEPVPEYDTAWSLSWSASGDDDYVTYIKDGNNIVGVTTTISFNRNLPAGMSFDVHFELNEQPVKTVNVVSNGQSQFTVTTGVTDFRFDTSTGATPSGKIRIDNEKNNISNREMYNIGNDSVRWVGKSVVQNTSAQPTPSGIHTYLEVNCGSVQDGGDHYMMAAPLSAKVTTSDTGGKIPKTVKFDVKLGSQTRTYSYPYSASNTYEWNSINDFSYEGSTYYNIENAHVEFTDGSSSSNKEYSGCIISLLRD